MSVKAPATMRGMAVAPASLAVGQPSRGEETKLDRSVVKRVSHVAQGRSELPFLRVDVRIEPKHLLWPQVRASFGSAALGGNGRARDPPKGCEGGER